MNKHKDQLNTKNKKCVNFDRGFCRHGEKCHYFHPEKNKVCVDQTCPNLECNLRHPNPCKFGQRCYFLRTNECLFSHVSPVCDGNRKMILELEKNVKNSDNQKKLDKMYEAIDKKITDKFVCFEKKIKDLEHSLEQKNSIITEMKQKIDKIENHFEKGDEKMKKIKDQIDDIIKNKNADQSKKGKQFVCNQCEYSTDSSRGLKTHVKRKHEKEAQTFPFKCELCDYEIEDKFELKNHLVKHSFRRVNFQCEECDYCGDNETTMAVHVGKMHSENIVCGICDFVADNLDNLETHLFTCEIYQCYYDDEKFKTLSDLKEHVKQEHTENNKHYSFIHAQQGRNSLEQIVCKTYTMSELFPELLHN